MFRIKNYTHRLEHAESFVSAKCELLYTRGLTIHIKHTRARGCDITGYYRWNDHRIVVAVKSRLHYPLTAAYSVANQRPGQRQLRRSTVWHEERFESPDDLLVFVAGHEIWHYLCDSGQRDARDEENRANRNGFMWLREFRRWRGAAQRVATTVMYPPRPDLVDAATALAYRNARGGRDGAGAMRHSDAHTTEHRPALAAQSHARGGNGTHGRAAGHGRARNGRRRRTRTGGRSRARRASK
jgi:hypothetical protein